jgi:hypothetical protein
MYRDKNSYLRRGISLYSAQLGGFIFCFVLLVSMSAILNYTWGRWILLFVLGFAYYITIFACMWDQGNRDLNRYKFGHIKKNYAVGFKVGAIGNIFWWVMILSMFLSKLGVCSSILLIFKWLAPPVWPIINLMCDSMYLSNFDWWMMFVILLAGSMITVISGLSYIAGFKEIIPVQKLMYSKRKPKEEDTEIPNVSDPRFKK